MHLIGCDFHTRFQQIAMVDSATGEILNRRLDHGTGEAQQFYAALPSPVRIGMEATGRTNWFERMLTKQPSVFHGFLPIPSFRCYYRVLGVCFRSQHLRPARLMGEFSDGLLTVVAATAMLYGLRSTLLQ